MALKRLNNCRQVGSLGVLFLALALAGCAGPGKEEQAPLPKRPNILFVIADQWRAESFGYAGNPEVQTPIIDRLARESINFSNAVSSVPVCSPTRASLLTGQRALTHGVFLNDAPLAPGAVTIAKVLHAAGYDTGCIGKWHVDGHGGRSSSRVSEGRDLIIGRYWNAPTIITTPSIMPTGRRS